MSRQHNRSARAHVFKAVVCQHHHMRVYAPLSTCMQLSSILLCSRAFCVPAPPPGGTGTTVHMPAMSQGSGSSLRLLCTSAVIWWHGCSVCTPVMDQCDIRQPWKTFSHNSDVQAPPCGGMTIPCVNLLFPKAACYEVVRVHLFACLPCLSTIGWR